MARLTSLQSGYRNVDVRYNQQGLSFRVFKYNGVTLRLNPVVDDQGITERPGLGDVEFCHTFLVTVGEYAIQTQRLPESAFEDGAEWEMQVRKGPWQKMTVIEPAKDCGIYRELLMTPALIS